MEPQPYRQRLEARMIDIAERLIATEGLAAVQARRIAVQADCSVGTIYNVFGGLDGLVIAANARTLKALGAKLETALRGAERGSLEDMLLALALAYRNFAVDEASRWRALFDHRMERDGEPPQSYVDERAALFGLVEECLRGVVADTPARLSAARALFSAVHGILVMGLDHKLGTSDSGETERQIRFLVGAAARGLIVAV